MSANSSVILTNLDFDTNKNSLKSFLASQDRFKDYNWDGSNASVLLDILSYNTHVQAFYLNMVGSEMFMDSSQIKDSMVSHAKELNYTPRSFSSARAQVNIKITSNTATKTSIAIPKGTQFSGKIDQKNFIFTTDENLVVTGAGSFTANNITIYEGIYIQEIFGTSERMILNNTTVDNDSISVTVIEDNGATSLTYTRALSLFDLDSNSKVFFIQGASKDRYEIVFGDGVIGRKPKDNSVVLVEYRTCNGELPNGVQSFKAVSPIDGETNILVTTVLPASSGAVAEDEASIKYNAPRHFSTQERAVTSSDYENLLKINFAEVNAATAFGGETLNPPIYGKVFVSVDLKDIDGLPQSKKDKFYTFLKARAPVSIDPVFVDPDYLYVKVSTSVKYSSKSGLTLNDIKTLVISAILDYSNTNLNNFARTLRYSRLVNDIDDADDSIISNETSVKAAKLLKVRDLEFGSVTLDFGMQIDSVESDVFQYKGKQSFFKDVDGVLYIAAADELITNIGLVDYSTGKITIQSFLFDSTSDILEARVVPTHLDIGSSKNTVISIRDEDISVEVQNVAE